MVFGLSMFKCFCGRKRKNSSNVSDGSGYNKPKDGKNTSIFSEVPKKKRFTLNFFKKLWGDKNISSNPINFEKPTSYLEDEIILEKVIKEQVNETSKQPTALKTITKIPTLKCPTQTNNCRPRVKKLSEVNIDISINEFKNDYVLVKKLGEGAFANVLMCVNKNDKKKYAVKVLKTQHDDLMDEETWDFVFELTVANNVKKHPCILSMEKVYHQPSTGCIHLVYELLKESLFNRLNKSGPLPDIDVKGYMFQILEGLKYLHRIGFVHRDLKPENILLGFRDRQLKIGDFGITCWAATNNEPLEEYVSTLWYRSPECLLTRGRYGKKMDLWAAGCIMYEMAIGGVHPLFQGTNEINQMMKIEEVLGRPDRRLLHRFEKFKSDVFYDRYLEPTAAVIAIGTGLQSVYPPYKSGFDLFKDIMVCDPLKRLSADRLLRKPYFLELQNSPHDCRIIEFEKNIQKNKKYDSRQKN